MQYRRTRSVLWDNGVAFPLERLYELLSAGTWSDGESEKVWNTAFPDNPYQLWSSDPSVGGRLQLQDVEIMCPWCTTPTIMELAWFRYMHVPKKGSCRCSSCGHKFDADALSARYLLDDLREHLEKPDAWYSHPLL